MYVLSQKLITSFINHLVYERLKKDMSEQDFRTEFEEYEDSAGNVFNKKTYEDLKRQGLI